MMSDDAALEYRACWESSYLLCNMYMDGQEGVGPHAGNTHQVCLTLIVGCLTNACLPTLPDQAQGS